MITLMYSTAMANAYLHILHRLPGKKYTMVKCSHISGDRYLVVEPNYLTSNVVSGDVVRVALTTDVGKPVLAIVATLGRYRYLMSCKVCKGSRIAPVRFEDCSLCSSRGSLDVVWSGYNL